MRCASESASILTFLVFSCRLVFHSVRFSSPQHCETSWRFRVVPRAFFVARVSCLLVLVVAVFFVGLACAGNQSLSPLPITSARISGLPQRVPTRRPAFVSGYGLPPSLPQRSAPLASNQSISAAAAVGKTV